MIRIDTDIPVWGTEIYVEATSKNLSEKEVRQAFSGIEAFFHDVDDELSTYKEDSSVTKLRRKKLKIEDSPEMVQEVWRGCLKARELSFGAFDP